MVDLGQLAQAGAAAIVGAMATDVWQQVRARVTRLFSSGDSGREQQDTAELDELYQAWVAADASGRRGVESELKGQLKIRLRSAPWLAEEFADVITEIRGQVAQTQQISSIQNTTTVQTATADRGGTVIQTGNVAGDQHLPNR